MADRSIPCFIQAACPKTSVGLDKGGVTDRPACWPLPCWLDCDGAFRFSGSTGISKTAVVGHVPDPEVLPPLAPLSALKNDCQPQIHETLHEMHEVWPSSLMRAHEGNAGVSWHSDVITCCSITLSDRAGRGVTDTISFRRRSALLMFVAGPAEGLLASYGFPFEVKASVEVPWVSERFGAPQHEVVHGFQAKRAADFLPGVCFGHLQQFRVAQPYCLSIVALLLFVPMKPAFVVQTKAGCNATPRGTFDARSNLMQKACSSWPSFFLYSKECTGARHRSRAV